MIRPPQYILLIALLMVLAADTASAQSSQRDFNVVVPPFMTLDQLQPDRTADHPQTSDDVLLGSSVWRGLTLSNSGSTIILQTEQPFQNQSIPSAQRDARLFIPFAVFFGSPWTLDDRLDETDFANGDLDASVQVSSSGPGLIFIPLQVTFITGDNLTLAGGTYQLTVTGTITAN